MSTVWVRILNLESPTSEIFMSDLLRARQLVDTFTEWMTTKVAPIARSKFPEEWEAWTRELDIIRGHTEREVHVRIALVGTIGAGKSSFLNAVLGQEVLPVGVMEPCTAFVTLVRHRPGDAYEVRVDYVTEDEWRSDLASFVELLSTREDIDDNPSESKRLINAYKKRFQALLDVTDIADVDAASLLDEPLPLQVQEIFRAGSVETRSFADAREMQQRLNNLIHGKSGLWPLVKQVSISGPYECLQGGLELVDLPGLNDPNEARVEVTREYLRTSPFVWVLFPMVRGLTHDIQTILSDEKVLRTLVLSGSYTALSLVGTKADDIDANHAEQLGLDPETASQQEIVNAYRAMTVDKARGQLEKMVLELATASDRGETLERMLGLARNAQVHGTSAAAYCKLKHIGRRRKDFGIENPDDTGIPGIHRLLHRISDEVGAESVARSAVDRLAQLAAEISLFLRSNSKASSRELANARFQLQEEVSRLDARINTALSEARNSLEVHRKHFLSKLDPLLQSSIQGVRRTINIWRLIQHMTLKAIVGRNGAFKSPSTGVAYDFNGDLTDPLLNQLPVCWESYFTEDLGRVRDGFVQRVLDAGTEFSQRAARIVEDTLYRQDDLLEKQLIWFREKVSLLAQDTTLRLIDAITERRRELASKMPFVARQSMSPAYSAAENESGTGMKGRILQKLETEALSSAPVIYQTIQSDLLEGLNGLEAMILRMFNELAQTANEQAKTVAHNAAIDIDGAVDPEIIALLNSVPKVAL
jgi:hypothetical protein